MTENVVDKLLSVYYTMLGEDFCCHRCGTTDTHGFYTQTNRPDFLLCWHCASAIIQWGRKTGLWSTAESTNSVISVNGRRYYLIHIVGLDDQSGRES